MFLSDEPVLKNKKTARFRAGFFVDQILFEVSNNYLDVRIFTNFRIGDLLAPRSTPLVVSFPKPGPVAGRASEDFGALELRPAAPRNGDGVAAFLPNGFLPPLPR